MTRILLRAVTPGDLATLFEQQLDTSANQMAAFTAKDPADRSAFFAKWTKILGDASITKRTILCDGRVVGNVVAFEAPWSGQLEVSYWLGREFWGLGIATGALREFLRTVATRPLYARAAKDNIASIRVLEKCGFVISAYEKGFANARGEEIDEVVLELGGHASSAVSVDRVAELSAADCEEVRLLSLAVYPAEQLADWPGRHMEWSTPEWCVRLRLEDGTLASYVGVYIREAACDGRNVRIGGVGNVKTHPEARGRGLAARGVHGAIEFFRGQPPVAFALLVCEPRLLEYYSRQGWREFGGELLVRQWGAACAFTLNHVMVHGVRSQAPLAGTIDLCGPPW